MTLRKLRIPCPGVAGYTSPPDLPRTLGGTFPQTLPRYFCHTFTPTYPQNSGTTFRQNLALTSALISGRISGGNLR